MTKHGSGSRMLHYINWRMRVILNDNRTMIGTFLAFDKHMNIVLSDTEEYRILKSSSKKRKQIDSNNTTNNTTSNEQRRTLGLILLRGEHVVSISPESAPPPKPKNQTLSNTGIGSTQPVQRNNLASNIITAPPQPNISQLQNAPIGNRPIQQQFTQQQPPPPGFIPGRPLPPGMNVPPPPPPPGYNPNLPPHMQQQMPMHMQQQQQQAPHMQPPPPPGQYTNLPPHLQHRQLPPHLQNRPPPPGAR